MTEWKQISACSDEMGFKKNTRYRVNVFQAQAPEPCLFSKLGGTNVVPFTSGEISTTDTVHETRFIRTQAHVLEKKKWLGEIFQISGEFCLFSVQMTCFEFLCAIVNRK